MRSVESSDTRHEGWRNGGAGLISVQRYDARGELKSEEVPAGRILNITPAERRMNEEMAVSDELNLFKNGMLTPVRLIESDEDFESIKSNKNLMSEEDMREVLKAKRNFKSTIAEVSNVGTLRRIAEIAKEDGSDVTLNQMKLLEERIIALVEPVVVNEVEVVSGPPRGPRP